MRDSTEEMLPSSRAEPISRFGSPVPSTAASFAETIDSGEEVHYYDEFDLFSDSRSDQQGTSDDEDSTFEDSTEKVGQSDSSIQPEHLQIASTLVPERSQRNNTNDEDTKELGDGDKYSPQTSVRPSFPCAGDCEDFNEGSVAEQIMTPTHDEELTDGGVGRRIQVVVRVRPPLDSEGKVVVTTGEKEGTSLCVQATTSQGSISTVTECTFDRVFMGAATQEDVFAAVEPSVQACLEGYNATIFAYGQTGTGKTHTLFGRDLGSPRNSDDLSGENSSFRLVKSSWGIVPRTLSYLLDQATVVKQKNYEVELHISFLQIYNDRLFDLLTDRLRQKPLLIREQPTLEGTTSVTVQGLSTQRITSFSDAMQIIHQGHTNRCVRETESNLSSSRSHAIVQLHVTVQCQAPDGDGRILRRARLNLVDLAGSEKWNTDVEMEDAHSQELKNINTSLSALGNCIAALTEAGRKHIPYRDSTLTRVLQDSFGGNTQSCLIATVSATQQSSDETIRTLHFADRARSVMQTIRVNEVANGSTELLMAKIQIVKLRERLENEQRKRHEIRLKEHQALQRDFQEKLKGKDKEITKLSRDNAVFQRWREEDVKKIRALESRLKDLQQQIEVNETREPADSAANTPLSRSKRQGGTVAISMTKHVAVHKTRSRTNLTRRGSENIITNQDYKQVLERYALTGSKGQQSIISQSNTAFSQTKSTCLSSYDFTNQVENAEENEPPALDTSSLVANARRQWELNADDKQAGDTSTRYVESGMCVSPVSYPQKRCNVAVALASSTCSSWAYPSLVSTATNSSTEWVPSVLSKSSLSSLIQKPEKADKCGKMLSSNPANSCSTSALKPVPTSLFRNSNIVSNNSLPRPSATEVCAMHKLAGCMLCSVNEGFRQAEVAPARQNLEKSTVCTTQSTLSGITRKVQDGPCERHQLLRCFICMKSANASVEQGTAPVSNFTSSSSTAKASNYQKVPLPTEGQLKCALHALANCILCAGIKAMTRKVLVPTPQPSPAKTSTSNFDVRGRNHPEERASDRYRRFTLDERLLNCQAGAHW
ncbi:unnamed protein product [Phytophthora lilii]|uniref:Unnamed protein product n=1 Tax=Phytophthora lilii TaxID=2077276 RepID=A0A9W6WVI5_9STRA|nr:unnamed protein product [Phytophthora lilii]